jgi:hypothetical protein
MTERTCFYCRGPLGPWPQTDHVLPRSRGGTDFFGNCVPVCETCNAAKNARTPSEWRTDLDDQVYALEASLLQSHPEFRLLPFVPRSGTGPLLKLAVSLEDWEREALRAIAARRGVPMTDVVRRLILDAIAAEARVA